MVILQFFYTTSTYLNVIRTNLKKKVRLAKMINILMKNKKYFLNLKVKKKQ